MHKVLPLLLAALVAGCGNSDGGEGEAAGSERRDFALTGFDRVSLSGPDNVEIAAGPAFKVEARGAADVLEKLRVTVEDGTLRVGREKGSTVVSPFGGKGRAIVRVTMPTVRGADLAGAGRLSIDKVDVPAFEGSLGGAGDYRIADLRARSAHFSLGGAGNLELAGRAALLDLRVSGAGNVNADELSATDLRVSMSGVGSVRAHASGRVTGELTGVGAIRVIGTERCDVRKSGVGSVKCAA